MPQRLPYRLLATAIVVLAAGPFPLGCRPERPVVTQIRAKEQERARPPVTGTHRAQGVGQLRLSEEQRGVVLARGSDFVITAGDMADELARQPLALRARYQAFERLKEFLRDLIAFEVMARSAVDEGLGRDPQVLHAAKVEIAERYLDQAAQGSVAPGDISDPEIKRAYDERPELSTTPEMVHLYVLSGDDLPRVQEAKKRLDEVKGEPDRVVARLKDMVETHGVPDLGVGKSGDAGFITRDGFGNRGEHRLRMVPAVVAEAAFVKLEEPGSYFGPVHTERGFMIVAAWARRPEQRRPLEEVAESIRAVLVQERRAEQRERIATEIARKAGFKVDEEAFEKVFGRPYKDSSAAAPEAPTKSKPRLKMLISPTKPRPIHLKREGEERLKKLIQQRPVPGSEEASP